MNISRTSVIEALASGKPDELLGLPETSWLDFKTSPYQIKSDKGKFELCKDVAAFANAQGGLLVLGISTKKQPDQALEVADKRHPFPQDKADMNSCIDVLNEHLRPRIEINHYWYADPDSADFYLVIDIAPVPETARYVIVRKMITDKGAFTEGVVIPQRHGDRTVFLPPDEVYGLINEAWRARCLPREMPVVITGLDLAAMADESVNEMEQIQDWAETPVLYFQSIPAGEMALLHDMFGSNGIEGALRDQDVLRQVGFNFEDSTGRLKVHGGGHYLNRGRCALWVRPNGLLTAGVVATTEMLCWAMEQRGLPQRINVHVLTEMALEYFRIADEVIKPRLTGPLEHRVLARNFQGDQPRLLGPGTTSYDRFLSDARPASTNMWDQSWQSQNDPELDAYEALRMVYALFGVDVTTNPDVQDRRVLVSRFRADSAQGVE